MKRVNCIAQSHTPSYHYCTSVKCYAGLRLYQTHMSRHVMLRHDMSHVKRTRTIARKTSSEMPNYSILSCPCLPCHYYFSLILPCPVLSCPVQLQSALPFPNLPYPLSSVLPYSVLSFLFPPRPALLIPTLHCPILHCVELHICTCMNNAFIYRSPTCRATFT